MIIDLHEKAALVTGSTGGIGFAIGKTLLEAGAAVTLNGPTSQLVDQALQKMSDLHPEGQLSGVVADLSTEAGCNSLVERLPQADILINNLGIFRQVDFFDTPDKEWTDLFMINVMPGVRLSRAYMPTMLKSGWGRIVFLSSEAALRVPVDMIPYAVTKTACLTLSRGLAKRAGGSGVTVNAIVPGPTLSEGLRDLLRKDQERSGKSIETVAAEFIAANRPSSIIRRPSTVEEIANLVLYISSPLSSATTGAALRVDGGVVDTIA